MLIGLDLLRRKEKRKKKQKTKTYAIFLSLIAR